MRPRDCSMEYRPSRREENQGELSTDNQGNNRTMQHRGPGAERTPGELRVTGYAKSHTQQEGKGALHIPGFMDGNLATEFSRVLQQKQDKHIRSFHTRARTGQLEEGEALRFLYDGDAAGRFDPETRLNMEKLIQKESFTESEIDAFAQDLDLCRDVARVSFNRMDYDLHEDRGLDEVDRAAMDLMQAKHPGLPLPDAGYGNDEQNQAVNELASFQLIQIASKRKEHDAVTQAARWITKANKEITTYNTTGDRPSWCDPELMTVPAEHREKGCNWLANRPLDPFADHRENAEYLRERLELAFGPNRSPELSYAQAGRMMLEQHLDNSLTGQKHKYDPDDWHYWDDGPINYDENIIPRFLEGNANDPMKHAEVSYARLIRDSLMHRGIVDDIGMKNPETLALSLSRNAAALGRMSDTLRHAVAHPPHRQTQHAVNTPLHWDMSPTERWQKTLDLTDNLTTTDKFREALENTLEQVAQHTTVDDSTNTDSVMRNYSFVQRVEVSPDTDVDHPNRLLLLEAIDDIRTACYMLEQVDQHLELAPQHQRSREYIAKNNLERYQKEGRSQDFIDSMRDYLENDFINQPGEFRTEHIYDETKEQIRAELAENGFANSRLIVQDGRKTALFDRAARLTTHVDFNLQAIASHNQ